MGFDGWSVLPDIDEDKFVLAFKDSSPAQGKPFMRTSDPMPEEWIRAELKEGGVSQDLIESSIAKAKEEWKKTWRPHSFEWEIEYIDLDALLMVLRLNHGSRRRIPIPIFDTGELYGWEVGDLIAIKGAPAQHREMEQAMGMPLSEDNYTLTNQKTGKTATVRFNDYEVAGDNAWDWLKDLEKRGILK